jgi:anti-sigma B factor antagonist
MPSPLETVRALWAAYEARGLDAMLEVAGEDVVWQPHPTDGRIARGGDALRAMVEGLARAKVAVEPRLLDVEGYGDAVLAHGTVVVRWPDGEVEERDRHWLFHFRDGRLVRQAAYASRDEALEVLAGLRAIAAPPLRVGEHSPGDGTSVLRVEGELDIATAPMLERALLAPRAPGERLVLDLCDLRFMDSTGLRVLMSARQAAVGGGWDFSLRDVPPSIVRLFSLAGVEDALPIDRF